jgi:hypothetical protein
MAKTPGLNPIGNLPIPHKASSGGVGELAEIVAERVVEMLEQRDRRRLAGLATAAEVAERLHVRKSWVYANQHQLGVIRLGDGPKARLRFDLDQAARAIKQDGHKSPEASPRQPGAHETSALPPGVELLQGRRG